MHGGEQDKDLVPCSREDTHELFERLERLAEGEVDVHLIKVLEVGGERCEMEGVVPLPRGRLLT